jgi:hypothetical protein
VISRLDLHPTGPARANRTAQWRYKLRTQDGTFGCHLAEAQNGHAKVRGLSAPAFRGQARDGRTTRALRSPE